MFIAVRGVEKDVEEDAELDEDEEEGYICRLLPGEEEAASSEGWPACLEAIARVKAITGRCLPGLTVRFTVQQMKVSNTSRN